MSANLTLTARCYLSVLGSEMVCKKIFAGLALVAIAVLSACSSAKLESSKAQDYSNTPTRLAVLADLGKEKGDSLGTNFPDALKSSLSACGVESSVEALDTLSIGPQRIAFAHPDAVLIIRWKTATNNRDGVVQADYHFELTDLASRKVVWKANMQFRPDRLGIGAAGTFTKGLMQRLKEDGILPPSCVVA